MWLYCNDNDLSLVSLHEEGGGRMRAVMELRLRLSSTRELQRLVKNSTGMAARLLLDKSTLSSLVMVGA